MSEKIEGIMVDGDALAEAIRRVSPLMSDYTEGIDGIYFEAGAGKLQLTATDGFQLGHLDVELPFPDGKRVLNGNGCKDFAGRHYNGEKVEAKQVDDHTMKLGDVVVPFGTDYPAYDTHKPADPDTIVILDPRAWIKAIRKGKPETIGVVYSPQGCRIFFAERGITQSFAEVPVQMFDGPEQKVAYKADQFRKALTNCKSTCTIKIKAPKDVKDGWKKEWPTLFEGEGNYWHLLMPHLVFPKEITFSPTDRELLKWSVEALQSIQDGEVNGLVLVGDGKVYFQLTDEPSKVIQGRFEVELPGS